MSMSNDMTKLINKIEKRLGLLPITPHLPEEFGKEAWAETIKDDTMVTFSRFFPRKVRFTINDETCHRVQDGKRWYYIIKDEYLGGVKLLGVQDIDWADTSADNLSIGQTAGYGYYIPNYGGIESTYDAFLAQQMSADVASLYNNNIFVEWEDPNKIRICRAGGIDVNLRSYVVNLLVQHSNLATISPTKMNIFEDLAQADIANFLFMNLRYYSPLDTIFINVDLQLGELEQQANRRTEIMDKLENSYVSASNDNIPYIMTVTG